MPRERNINEEAEMDATEAGEERQAGDVVEHAQDEPAPFVSVSDREMPCPMCGASMPDLKGGKGSICPNCGFKDSCCY